MNARKPIEEMSGPELVAEHNRLRPDKPVKRFKDRAAGMKAVQKLLASVSGAQASSAAEKETVEGDKGVRVMSGKLIEEFGVRAESNRAKVLTQLVIGKAIKRAALLKAVYGSGNEKNVGALSMVFKGLEQTIKAEKLPYEIKRTKDDNKEVSYGIFRKH